MRARIGALLLLILGWGSTAAVSNSASTRPNEMAQALGALKQEKSETLRQNHWKNLLQTLATLEAELTAHPPNPKQRDDLWILQTKEWLTRLDRKGFSPGACQQSLKTFHTWVDPKSKDLKHAPDSALFAFEALQARCKQSKK